MANEIAKVSIEIDEMVYQLRQDTVEEVLAIGDKENGFMVVLLAFGEDLVQCSRRIIHSKELLDILKATDAMSA